MIVFAFARSVSPLHPRASTNTECEKIPGMIRVPNHLPKEAQPIIRRFVLRRCPRAPRSGGRPEAVCASPTCLSARPLLRSLSGARKDVSQQRVSASAPARGRPPAARLAAALRSRRTPLLRLARRAIAVGSARCGRSSPLRYTFSLSVPCDLKRSRSDASFLYYSPFTFVHRRAGAARAPRSSGATRRPVSHQPSSPQPATADPPLFPRPRLASRKLLVRIASLDNERSERS